MPSEVMKGLERYSLTATRLKRLLERKVLTWRRTPSSEGFYHISAIERRKTPCNNYVFLKRRKRYFGRISSQANLQRWSSKESKGQYLKSSGEAFNVLKPMFAEVDDVEMIVLRFHGQKE